MEPSPTEGQSGPVVAVRHPVGCGQSQDGVATKILSTGDVALKIALFSYLGCPAVYHAGCIVVDMLKCLKVNLTLVEGLAQEPRPPSGKAVPLFARPGFIDDYYSRRGATVETAWPRALRFLTTTLANEAFRLEGENVAMLAAGAARDELQVERVTLRIQASPEPPHAAAADFDLVRLVNGAEVGRDRWTLSLQFTFVETVDPELMIVNPMGILITYLRGDRALVTG